MQLIYGLIEHAVEHFYGHKAPYRNHDEQYYAYSQRRHCNAGDIFNRPNRRAYVRRLRLGTFEGSRLDILRDQDGILYFHSSRRPP
jgi:hypothetical protein